MYLIPKFLLFSFILMGSCHKDMQCVNELIESQRKEISAVYSYNYLGQTVYDFNPEGVCCDLANTIYSSDCTVICVLNGLIGNQICKGDTFYLKATNKTLIWKK